jgi:starch phosphorylase
MNEIEREEIIAYFSIFSIEISLESMMPTYSGGLGMLAGDTIRPAADAGERVKSAQNKMRLHHLSYTVF